jgi:hypothetical protein
MRFPNSSSRFPALPAGDSGWQDACEPPGGDGKKGCMVTAWGGFPAEGIMSSQFPDFMHLDLSKLTWAGWLLLAVTLAATGR